ncbi:MAG: hypothetical protein OEV40_30030 [Acidimicrobiia bacterium]|nr:hypothetical protein [Acidimicrobiia bacterium]
MAELGTVLKATTAEVTATLTDAPSRVRHRSGPTTYDSSAHPHCPQTSAVERSSGPRPPPGYHQLRTTAVLPL